MEYSNGIFDSRFCCYALNGLYNDAFGFFACCQLGIVHDVVDVGLRLCLGFFLQGLYHTFFGFFGGKAGNSFQFLDFLALHVFQFLFLLVDDNQLGFQILFHRFGFHFLALNFFLTLVQHQFALFQLVFCLLYLLITQ